MSPDFPTTAGAFDGVWNGDALIFWADAFAAKFAVGAPLPSPTPPPPDPAPAPAAPTLVAPANDAVVAQPVTLDWTNVTGAASYEVQVDNWSTIAAPLVATPTVSVSQVTLGTLPAQQLWWRVRARNSDGVFGPFSTTSGNKTRTCTFTLNAAAAVMANVQ